MTPIFLIHALITTQAPAPSLAIAFEAPSTVVAGLPLLLPYRLDNANDRPVDVELGTNEMAFATIRILDARGATVAVSRPEVEVPFRRGADYASRYFVSASGETPTANIRPGTSRKGTLIPWLDTTRLVPGRYTLDVQVATTIHPGLPVRNGDAPQAFRWASRYPIEVKVDKNAVSARCFDLLAQIHRPKPKGGTADVAVRELCLADRSVTLPMLKNDPAPWSRLQTEYVAKGLVPYATPDDAQVIALFAQRSPFAFVEALKLMERSPDPEVARIATEIKQTNGNISP